MGYLGYLLSEKLFREPNPKEDKEKVLICPKCGSRDWKFPNPLMASENMINTYFMVNEFSECQDCGYIGIFFEANKETADSIAVKPLSNTVIPKKKKLKFAEYCTIVFLIIIVVLTFLLIGNIGGTLLGLGAALSYGRYLKNTYLNKGK